jgi:hypothetical protein
MRIGVPVTGSRHAIETTSWHLDDLGCDRFRFRESGGGFSKLIDCDEWYFSGPMQDLGYPMRALGSAGALPRKHSWDLNEPRSIRHRCVDVKCICFVQRFDGFENLLDKIFGLAICGQIDIEDKVIAISREDQDRLRPAELGL